jgi:histidinol phosphatase-like PHP family hydrolase
MRRRTFLKNAVATGSFLALNPLMGKGYSLDDNDFPVMDLHVHITRQFTIKNVMEIAAKNDVKFGIVDHPAQWAIKNDEDLQNYIDKLREYPVYIGLQPTITGWMSAFSPSVLDQVDYILMDPQTIPVGDGSYLRIWQFDTPVEDTAMFMEKYMEHSLNILNNEPINIFGWPLFLPVCIARDYYRLWTDERMQQLIDAAKARNIAFEINEMSHTPHEEFIVMAKEQGLKFTFGSDARDMRAGRLTFCKRIAKKCGLKREDFFIPV